MSSISPVQVVYIFNTTKLQELCRRWEQYVLDHQAYTASFDQCKGWVVSMRKKLASQSDVKGDKRTVQERIEKLKVKVVSYCFRSDLSMLFVKGIYLTF